MTTSYATKELKIQILLLVIPSVYLEECLIAGLFCEI